MYDQCVCAGVCFKETCHFVPLSLPPLNASHIICLRFAFFYSILLAVALISLLSLATHHYLQSCKFLSFRRRVEKKELSSLAEAALRATLEGDVF